MKNILLPLFFVSLLISCGGNTSKTKPATTDALATYADSVNTGIISPDTLKASVPRVATATIDDCEITIEYTSPGVRGRTIWGELVPFGKVWVAGAHMATKITFSAPVTIDNTVVAPGTYAFFVLPEETGWTLILNKNFDQHLASKYDASLDLLRFFVTPETLKTAVPRLTYLVEESSGSSHHLVDRAADASNGNIVLQWEFLQAALPFSVN